MASSTQAQRLRYFLAIVLVACAIFATRFYEVDKPILRFLRGHNQVDPSSLHLAGEFVESNLGTAQELDGSFTVRLIAEQYLFVPHCVLVPAGVPIRFRITSADAVHKLTFTDTDYSVKVVPGTISQARFQFSAGDYRMPCREFCGAGHYAMRSHLLVVPREQFPALRSDERRDCGAR